MKPSERIMNEIWKKMCKEEGYDIRSEPAIMGLPLAIIAYLDEEWEAERVIKYNHKIETSGTKGCNCGSTAGIICPVHGKK